MVAIYRIQDDEGRGPWRPAFSDKWVSDRTANEYELLVPTHIQFPNLRFDHGKHYGVGCRSLKTLRLWILEQEYRKLRMYGYQCVKIEADKIIAESSIQCVFSRSIPLSENIRLARLYPMT